MIVIDKIDRTAKSIADRYSVFSSALSGALLNTAKVRLEPKDLVQMRKDIARIRGVFGNAETENLMASRSIIVNKAMANFQEDTGLTIDNVLREAIEGNSVTIISDAIDSVTMQTLRDASAVMSQARRLAIESRFLSINLGGMSSGIVDKIITKRQSTYLDRAGRRWDSSKFAKTLVRKAMIDIYNESYLIAAIKFGRDHLYTTEGMKIDVVDYEIANDDIFHPNTRHVFTLSTDV